MKKLLTLVLMCAMLTGCGNSGTSALLSSSEQNSTVNSTSTETSGATEQDNSFWSSNTTSASNETSTETAGNETASNDILSNETSEMNPYTFAMNLVPSENWHLTTGLYGNLIFNGNKTWTILRFGDESNRIHLITAKIDDASMQTENIKDITPLFAAWGDQSFAFPSSNSSGYIIGGRFSLYTDTTYSYTQSGSCVFKFTADNQMEWSKCFSYPPGFTDGMVFGNNIYLVYNCIAGGSYRNFAVLNEENGTVVTAKSIKYNGSVMGLNSLYVDSSGIYLAASWNHLVLKLGLTDFEPKWVKEIEYPSISISIPFILGDENYIYVVASPGTSYHLWKLDKNTGDLVFVKTILGGTYSGTYYQPNEFPVVDGFVDNDSIYFVAHHSYAPSGGRVIKIDKDGNLLWATKISGECMGFPLKIRKGYGNTVTILGTAGSNYPSNSYVVLNLDSETGLIQGVDCVTNATADEIGFGESITGENLLAHDVSSITWTEETLVPFGSYYFGVTNASLNATLIYPSGD